VRADPCKGRFRTYLLTALTRYAGAERRKDQAKKRMARRADLPPESIDLSTLPDPHSAGSPDRVFGQAWAADLLARAMADVEAECRADGRATHWAVFYERVVKPILEDVEPPALESLCSQFGIEGEKTASNMVITVKLRFRATVRRLLGQTLGPGGDVDEELNDLIAILVDHAGAA